MYRCEAWTIFFKMSQKKLEATEMLFLRKMLRVLWTVKKSNATVLREAEATKSVIKTIRSYDQHKKKTPRNLLDYE